MRKKLFDLIVIGAGPAGITAAVYAARQRMDFLLLTIDIGGQTAWSSDIQNYTGYQFITGIELSAKFEEHMKNYAIDVKENEAVKNLAIDGENIKVTSDKDVYEARTVIIASGKKSKELGVPGEKEFKNKGITYCATCDGPLFAGKNVAVVGGGNSALDAVLQLMKIAKKVFVINIADELGGDAIMREKVMNSDKVTVINNAEVAAAVGGPFVKGIKIRKDGEEDEIPVEGIFVEIGLLPNSGFSGSITKNEAGEIKVNCRNETNLPGVFAAGDVTDVPEKQIIVAAGEGAKAALSAFKYLAGRR